MFLYYYCASEKHCKISLKLDSKKHDAWEHFLFLIWLHFFHSAFLNGPVCSLLLKIFIFLSKCFAPSQLLFLVATCIYQTFLSFCTVALAAKKDDLYIFPFFAEKVQLIFQIAENCFEIWYVVLCTIACLSANDEFFSLLQVAANANEITVFGLYVDLKCTFHHLGITKCFLKFFFLYFQVKTVILVWYLSHQDFY